MAVTYGFFNSVNGDRKYNAEQMTDFYNGICTDGVFQAVDGALEVTAGTGLQINIATGRAIVKGHWVKNDAVITQTISPASTTYARIDVVRMKYDASNRQITFGILTGTPAANPEAPALTRNSTVWEMALAYVNVVANATSVTVTDKRSSTSLCGWAAVAQAIDGEYEAMIDAMKTGFDEVTYQTPAAQVIGSDTVLDDYIKQNDSKVNSVYPDRVYIKRYVNGSAVNPGNTNLITCEFDVTEFRDHRMKFVFKRPFSSDGNHYSYGYYAYNDNGTQVSAKDVSASDINNNYIYITNTWKTLKVIVGEFTSGGVASQLRYDDALPYESYACIFENPGIVDEFANETGVMEGLYGKIHYASCISGTFANANNAWAIKDSNYIPVNKGDIIEVKVKKTIEFPVTYHYYFYNSSKTQVAAYSQTTNKTVSNYDGYVRYFIYDPSEQTNLYSTVFTDPGDIYAVIYPVDSKIVEIEDEIKAIRNGASTVDCSILNGSIWNGLNSQRVHTDSISVIPDTVMTIHVNKAPTDGCRYAFNYQFKDSGGNIVSQRDFQGLDSSFAIGSNYATGMIGIDMIDYDGNLVTLRSSNFEVGDVCVTFDNGSGIIDENKDKDASIEAAVNNNLPSRNFGLLVLTDVHGTVTEVNSWISFLNNNNYALAAANLGDTTGGYYTDSDGTWYSNIVNKSCKPVYTVIGNHDVWKSTSVSDGFTKWIYPTRDKIGISDLDKSYYYRDNLTYSIRFIMLDNYDHPSSVTFDGDKQAYECYTQEQIDWFISTLASTPSSYSVVICRHSAIAPVITDTANPWCDPDASIVPNYDAYSNQPIVESIVNAWIHSTSISESYASRVSGYPTLTVSADFSSSANGKFICYLCGHVHSDACGYVEDYSDQKVIAFTTSSYNVNQNSGSDLPRQIGSVTQHALTLVAFDTTNKLIKMVRLGSERTIFCKNREYCVIEY